MRCWWRWRRELRALRREMWRAHDAWTRARYAYADDVVVFRDQPGAWGDAGPIGRAQDESWDRMNEYVELRRRFDRLKEMGPEWAI